MRQQRRTMMNDERQLEKVMLRGPDGEVETLWAERLGKNRYRLDNLPFFAYGVSWQDVIETERRDGTNEFVRVIEKSGNRTVRVILDEPADESETMRRVLDGLTEIGCSLERMTQRYIVVNVPLDVDLETVQVYLNASEQRWEHADPTYDELYSEESDGEAAA